MNGVFDHSLRDDYDESRVAITNKQYARWRVCILELHGKNYSEWRFFLYFAHHAFIVRHNN